MGIPFLAAAVALAASRFERAAAWLIVPAAIWCAWFVAYGESEIDTFVQPDFTSAPAFVAQSVAHSLTAISGLPYAFAALVVVAGIGVRNGWRPSPLMVSAAVGIVVEFTIIGALQRVPNASRYQTTVAAFLAVGAAGIEWPFKAASLRIVAVTIFVIVLGFNVAWLIAGPHMWALITAGANTCDPLVAPLTERGC